MSNDGKPAGGEGSLPEQIAAEAGLPRGDTAERSLHALDERARAEGKASLEAARAGIEDAAGRVGASVESEAREAAETASDLSARVKDRVSAAADAARERVGDTLDQARDYARGHAAETYGRAADAYDDVRSWAADRYDAQRDRAAALAERGYGRLRDGRTATEDFVSAYPLLVGVVGLAAGLLLGALLPRTRREDAALGPWADEVRGQGLRYARDMTHRGRAFVENALDPDNLDAAVRRAAGPDDGHPYEGTERTAHRL